MLININIKMNNDNNTNAVNNINKTTNTTGSRGNREALGGDLNANISSWSSIQKYFVRFRKTMRELCGVSKVQNEADMLYNINKQPLLSF